MTVPANDAALGALYAASSTGDGGTARLYAGAGFVPTSTNHTGASIRTGNNALVLAEDRFDPSQSVVFLVRYVPSGTPASATVTMRAGEVIVRDLGALSATEGANSGDVVVGPEGHVFFRTTVPANTPAWALWARTNTGDGAPNTNAAATVRVRRLKVPMPGFSDRGSTSG